MVTEVRTYKLCNIGMKTLPEITLTLQMTDRQKYWSVPRKTKPSAEQLTILVRNADSLQIVSFHIHFSGYYSCVTWQHTCVHEVCTYVHTQIHSSKCCPFP